MSGRRSHYSEWRYAVMWPGYGMVPVAWHETARAAQHGEVDEWHGAKIGFIAESLRQQGFDWNHREDALGALKDSLWKQLAKTQGRFIVSVRITVKIPKEHRR